jgi:DNA-binding MarR family transcriptional regulator
MEADKHKMIQQIMQTVEEIYKLIGPAVPEEWLSSDITVTQLRLLLILQSFGPLRMSDIASRLMVTLPTATIEVNSLVRKNLVQRESTSEDRRVVIVALSPEGQALIKKLWGSGQTVIERLLEGLSSDQIHKTAELVSLLYQSACKLADARNRVSGIVKEREE